MENKNKIAIITLLFPNLIQTYILNQIIFLRKRGFQVNIIANAKGNCGQHHPAIKKYDLLDKANYSNLNGFRNISKEVASYFIPNYNFIGVAKRWGKLLRSRNWLQHGLKYFLKEMIRAKVVSKATFNILHSHSIISSYDYLFLKEVFGIPLITTFHGIVPASAQKLDKDRLQKVVGTGDLFLVNTEFAKAQLVSLGCKDHKITILPQGTDTRKFKFKERVLPGGKKIVLLTVGRLSPEKGINYAIDAVAKLISSYPGLEHHIVGDGPERNNLQRQIDKLGLQNKVKMLGLVPTEELLSQYEQAHIFILPSVDLRDGYHVETQGVVLQEAQATGLPVIATKTGGIPECITDGLTGLLVEERNPEDIANKIRFLIDNPDKYRDLSFVGRRDVEERFDIDKIGERLLKIYEDVLMRSKH